MFLYVEVNFTFKSQNNDNLQDNLEMTMADGSWCEMCG